MSRVVIYTPPDANRVLRGVRLLADENVDADLSDYVTVEIGIASGASEDYYSTYTGSTQALDASDPFVLMSGASHKIPKGNMVVARTTSIGAGTLEGLSLQIQVGHTLTMPGHRLSDAATQAAIDGVGQFLNDTQSGDQYFTVPLRDAVDLTATNKGRVCGRLDVDSTTQLSLGAYAGRYVEVAGTLVDLSTDLTVTTTTGLITSQGVQTSTALSSSTLYYAYVSKGGALRLSATAPTLVNGQYHLINTGSDWLFMGYVYSNSSTQFVDSVAFRNLANYYNRVTKQILLTPAYSDGNTRTTYTTTSTTYTTANGGTGSVGGYVANGEDAVHLSVWAHASNSGANNTYVGIGENSTTTAVATALNGHAAVESFGCAYSFLPAAGYRTANLLVRVSAGTGTFVADDVRGGSSADPYVTFLSGLVRV